MNATMTWTAGTLASPITTTWNLLTSWQQIRDLPEDPDTGTAGVREPRRPLPAPPSLSMAIAW